MIIAYLTFAKFENLRKSIFFLLQCDEAEMDISSFYNWVELYRATTRIETIYPILWRLAVLTYAIEE